LALRIFVKHIDAAADQPARGKARQILADVGLSGRQEFAQGAVDIDDGPAGVRDHQMCRQRVHCQRFGKIGYARAGGEHPKISLGHKINFKVQSGGCARRRGRGAWLRTAHGSSHF
jgi:hypothetical protein